MAIRYFLRIGILLFKSAADLVKPFPKAMRFARHSQPKNQAYPDLTVNLPLKYFSDH
jgi:hypothetical protein